jgi:UDP-N-acetylmuramyl tripeptide synthase
LRIGAGGVLPGEIAARIEPGLLEHLSSQFKSGVVLIAGTNGKTTSSALLRAILERRGFRVVHNETGANLENGLVTALVAHADWRGQIDADFAILEVDENVLPNVVGKICPRLVIGLNLFRDQLDRYGEVDLISAHWNQAIAPLARETVVILNADDPTLSFLGQGLSQRVLFFGLSEPARFLGEMPHAVDSIYCPRCGNRLNYRGVYFSHLGDYICPHCGFERSEPEIDSNEWGQALVGLYNKYNTLAVVLAARELGVDDDAIREAIADFHAVFGRSEELVVEGKRVRILLSKNPVGMNETIRTVLDLTRQEGHPPTTMLVLNDRIPDGTDVSWIWDVDTERLIDAGARVIVSGDRAFDMGLRMAYSRGSEPSNPGGKLNGLTVEPDVRKAVKLALVETPEDGTLYLLPTYSAMLDIRGILTGRKIL